MGREKIVTSGNWNHRNDNKGTESENSRWENQLKQGLFKNQNGLHCEIFPVWPLPLRCAHRVVKEADSQAHHHTVCSPLCVRRQNKTKKKGIKFAYQLAVTFGHITFRRTARVFPILTRPLHCQRAVAAEGVDQAGCMKQTSQGPSVSTSTRWHLHHPTNTWFSPTVAHLAALWPWNAEQFSQVLIYQMWPSDSTTFSVTISKSYHTKIFKCRSIKSLLNTVSNFALNLHCFIYNLLVKA